MHSKRLLPIAALLISFTTMPVLAQKGMLRATVVDVDGEPVVGVQVTVTSEGLGTYRENLTTDKRGTFKLRFQSNQAQYQFEMLFEKPGFQSFTVPFTPTMTQPMKEQFVMEPGVTQVAESHGDLAAIVTGSANAAVEAFNEGLSAQREGQLPLARERFEAALEVDPDLMPAVIALSQVLLDLGDYETALARAEEALAGEAPAAAVLSVQYQALRALGREGEAEAVAEALEVAEGAAASARRIYNEGGQAYQIEDRETALRLFREAAQLDPSLIEAHHAVASLELANGNAEQAAASAEKALALGSDDIATLRVLYDAYDALGRIDELTEIAPRLAAVDPDYGGSKLLEQAAAAWNAGQAENAARLSRLALAVDSSLAKAYYFIGLHHISKGENTDGKVALEKFISLAPDDGDAATARDMIGYL